jgi:exonuclease III
MNKLTLSFFIVILTWKLHGQSTPEIGRDYTLEICNWNIEWFGKNGFGPKDKELQFLNVKNFIEKSEIDIFALQEVANIEMFDRMMKQLPKYHYCISNHSSELKTAFAFKKDMFELIACKNIGIDSQTFFSTGRFPLEIILVPRFDIGLDTLFLINLHLKAHTGNTQEKQNAYQSRKRSCEWLLKYIIENRMKNNLMVLGDWNDDVDESIFNGWPTPMSGLIKQQQLFFITQSLSNKKIGTTVKYLDAIDHQMLTSKLMQKWVSNNVDTVNLKNYIASYATTTSDHFPVVSFYNTYTLGAKLVKLHLRDSINVYPNPVKDRIVLFNGFNINNVRIFDAKGKLLKVVFNVCENEINDLDLPNGMYWMMGVSEGNVFKLKFLIEK